MSKFVFLVAILVSLPVSTAVAETYDVIVKSAKIASKKSDGRSWDFAFGKPDPRVEGGLRTGDDEVTGLKSSPTKDNTHTPYWNFKVAEASLGDQVLIQVVDVDVSRHDMAGRYTLTITKDLIKKGGDTVFFGQVSNMSIVIRKSK